MKPQRVIVALLALSVLMAGCAPMVTVQNSTKFPVRVVVVHPGGKDVVSPSPGESSSVEAAEGPFSVAVIPDQEWIEYAKQMRKFLNEQLANADHLTGPQLLDVINRLKDIAARMQQYEQAAQASGAACSGRLSENGGGVVQVSTSANGALVVVCK